MSLPASVGSAALLDLLPDELVELYNSPANLVRSPEELSQCRLPSVRPVRYANDSEWTKLVCRLQSIGMVKLTAEPLVVNGVFGVPKDESSIRLIVDARPANRALRDPARVCLPTPDILASMVAPADEPFCVAKVDLNNFYHRLRLP